MRVIEVSRFGEPDVLAVKTVPDAVAGAGQAVIAVSVVPVLFLDTQLRTGWGAEYFGVTPPYVPGAGVAGRVSSVGSGVDPGWMGRLVVADAAEGGGYVEQAAVPAEALIAVPVGMDLPEAAALLHDGRTAMRLADVVKIRPGEDVLVTAAAGGLGVLLTQIARAVGARVIAAARGEAKLGLARELGADVVLDYSDSDWEDRVRDATGGRGVDVVLDGAGGRIGETAFRLVADGGRMSAHGAPSGGFAAPDPAVAERRGVTVTGIGQVQASPADRKRLTEQSLSEAAAGVLKPVIGQAFPLERAAEAHATIERRDTLGKTLLLV
jgi:NADPH2:quinone reductase